LTFFNINNNSSNFMNTDKQSAINKIVYFMKSILVILLLFISKNVYADNPIVRHIFTADPAPLVYNDTFYIFTGHDEGIKNTSGWILKGWHVLSSVDMVNWTDHGDVLSVKDITWLNSNQAWAAQCVYRNGKFYFYICDSGEIGVAVADNILGPYKDALGKPLISNATNGACPGDDNIDPSVFIDDDGQAYIYWGTDGVARQAKLKSSMTEIDGSITVPQGITKFFEASWVHKFDKTYYYSYAAYNSSGKSWPSNIDYATSSGPLGPWTYKGTLNGYAGTGTNHSGIMRFKDVWYYVYATDYLSDGTPWQRSVQIDYLYYSADGTMKKIVQTAAGVNSTCDPPFAENVYYKIKAEHSGKLANVAASSKAPDAAIKQTTDNGNYSQHWKFVKVENGIYEIVNRNSGLALDAGLSNNSVVQYTSKGTDNQKWKITGTTGGCFLFVNKANNRLLEVINAYTNDSAIIQHWEFNGESCQKWELIRADSTPTSSRQTIGVISSEISQKNSGAEIRLFNNSKILPYAYKSYSLSGRLLNQTSCIKNVNGLSIKYVTQDEMDLRY